jgi:glycerol-3-phosphate dehydrogenase
VRAGIALYDLLTGTGHRSRFWEKEPSYEDAAVNDARFCLEIVLDARRHGALALNYLEWLEWIRHGDRIVGARVRDRFTGEEGVASAGMFVNAAGPWADLLVSTWRRNEPLLRLTRGTHVVLDRRPDNDARLFFAPQDGRVLFLLPYEDGTGLLSTTDLDEPTPSKDPIPLGEEIEYLRGAFRSQFPEWAHWKPIGLQCGLRPLLAGDGSPSELSREERLVVDAAGSLVSILGGKYTTYRTVAERAVDTVLSSLGREPGERPTRDAAIPGSADLKDAPARIRRAFAEEDAVRIEDVFLRRTSLGDRGLVDGELLDQAAKLWRLRWGKSEDDSEVEAQAFLRLQERRLGPLSNWGA